MEHVGDEVGCVLSVVADALHDELEDLAHAVDFGLRDGYGGLRFDAHEYGESAIHVHTDSCEVVAGDECGHGFESVGFLDLDDVAVVVDDHVAWLEDVAFEVDVAYYLSFEADEEYDAVDTAWFEEELEVVDLVGEDEVVVERLHSIEGEVGELRNGDFV